MIIGYLDPWGKGSWDLVIGVISKVTRDLLITPIKVLVTLYLLSPMIFQESPSP